MNKKVKCFMKHIILIFCIGMLLSCIRREENTELTTTTETVIVYDQNAKNEILDESEAIIITDINEDVTLLYDFIQSGYFIDMNTAWTPINNSFRFRAPNIVEYIASLSPIIWAPATEGVESETGVLKSGTYRIEHNHAVAFIIFYWDDGTTERYLMLLNRDFHRGFMILYANNAEQVFFGRQFDEPYYFGYPWHGGIVGMAGISASPTLTENHDTYSATHERSSLYLSSAWASEGGIGEQLFVRLYPQVEPLFISTGYIHFSRPYLFKYNSRPKRIRISAVRDEMSYYEFELEDTPHFQSVTNPIMTMTISYGYDIKIEILEVFSGTRYDHIAIHSILGFFSQ